VSWTPTIAPAGTIYYSADVFPELKGSILIAGLASTAIIQIEIDGDAAREKTRFPMGDRIREIEQGPNGALWVLEDGDGGRLLKLLPKNP
jgi:glucose/arabinose dehydrogenase